MAVPHPSIQCPLCGGNIPFKHNPPKEGFVGDTGGEYDYAGHTCSSETREQFDASVQKKLELIEL